MCQKGKDEGYQGEKEGNEEKEESGRHWEREKRKGKERDEEQRGRLGEEESEWERERRKSEWKKTCGAHRMWATHKQQVTANQKRGVRPTEEMRGEWSGDTKWDRQHTGRCRESDRKGRRGRQSYRSWNHPIYVIYYNSKLNYTDIPDSWQFYFWFMDFTMAWKPYTFSRNCTSNFEFGSFLG